MTPRAVVTTITRAMHTALRQLGYAEDDIHAMAPAQAWELITRRVRKATTPA